MIIWLSTGFHAYQVVQDFGHQLYLGFFGLKTCLSTRLTRCCEWQEEQATTLKYTDNLWIYSAHRSCPSTCQPFSTMSCVRLARCGSPPKSKISSDTEVCPEMGVPKDHQIQVSRSLLVVMDLPKSRLFWWMFVLSLTVLPPTFFLQCTQRRQLVGMAVATP